MARPALDLILHNIRSAYNVGAIFRTADGAGIIKIYLTGYTPAPIDQFKRPNGEIKKTALGAEETVAWEKWENVLELIAELKRVGVKIWALEQTDNSTNYRETKLEAPTALIVGNEVEGIEPEVLAQCDQIIEIPMRGALARHKLADGGKESLNVTVATGIAIFQILDK